MNSGDGWYGGVYIAAMYALAFVRDDIERIAEEALAAIPAETTFARAMADVIRRHREDPNDWKTAWFKVQRAWGEDIGCPEGVFDSFNIDAKVNCAWVLIGLLYGDGDFGKTLDISQRCGDDSDCNPASAGGILGTMLGYKRIPAAWTNGLERSKTGRSPTPRSRSGMRPACPPSRRGKRPQERREGRGGPDFDRRPAGCAGRGRSLLRGTLAYRPLFPFASSSEARVHSASPASASRSTARPSRRPGRSTSSGRR